MPLLPAPARLQDDPDVLYQLGVAAMEAGEADGARALFERTVSADPRHAEAHNNLGVLARDRGDDDRALAHYRAALEARPRFPEALNNVAVIRTERGAAADAVEQLEAAIALRPGDANPYNNLGVARLELADAAGALAWYERCLERDPEHRAAQHNRLVALNYLRPGDDPALAEAHAAWGERFAARVEALPPLSPEEVARRAEDPARPLVVGYLSPDLRAHSVSYFIEAPLRHHARERVEVIVYSAARCPDETTRRLRSATEAGGHRWREVGDLPEDALARLVRQDRVDLLVELSGHTSANRLGCLAMKPSPVQVSWIGYPHPTGLDAIGHWITDAECTPDGGGAPADDGRWRLPGCFLCYTPGPRLPGVAPLPALANGAVTFGCFNNLAKLTPEVLGVWARVLAAVPGSRLALKWRALTTEHGRARVLARLESHGLDPRRITLLPWAPTAAAHLAAYACVDVSLDVFPYAGTTTTCESLVMGVPVVTLRGGGHAQNVGASLLAAAGLGGEWIASSADAYVALARRAAADLPGLAAVRAGLRERVLASPLCDGPAFVARLEVTYRELWERWRASARASAPGRPERRPARGRGGQRPRLEVVEDRVVERDVRLSRSRLWDLQRRYFDREGVEAWRTNTVPHHVTNNPALAEAYAEVVLGHLRDATEAGWLAHGEPFTIVELGAGSGRFAHLFLRAFRRLLRATPLAGARVRYVLTDVAEKNVAFARAHEVFQPLIAEGLLDLARFDAERDDALRLELSGETLGPGALRGPLVAVANYVFDSIPADAFAFDAGTMRERLVTLRAREDGIPLDDPAVIDRLELAFTARGAPLEYYGEADLDALLEAYAAQLDGAAILFPVAALRCLRRLAALSSRGLLVLSADKGQVTAEALRGAGDPYVARHGSFSLSVNYHALGAWAEGRGGRMLRPRERTGHLATVALLVGDHPTGFAETRARYDEALARGGPGDVFALRLGLQERYGELRLEQLLALVRLVRDDPRVLGDCLPSIEAQLADAPAALRRELGELVEQAWGNYYHLGEPRDLPFALGHLLFRLGEHGAALVRFEDSRRWYGDDPRARWNAGLCHAAIGDRAEAARCFAEALAAGFTPVGALQGKDEAR